MSKSKAEFLLIFTVMATSASYLLMKLGSGHLEPFNLIALRFGLAFVAIGLFSVKHWQNINLKTVGVGALLGLTMFVLLTLQVYGLETVSTSNAGFLASTAVVFVPLIQAVLRRKLPQKQIIAGVVITMTGIAFLTLRDQLAVSRGVWIYLLSAVFYAGHVVIADRFAKQVDLLAASLAEMATGSILGLVFSFSLEAPRLPAGGAEWAIILGLGLFCSFVGWGLQPHIQQYTTPERYGLLFGMGPLFSTLYGMVFLQELMDLRGWLGAALVIGGVLYAGRQPGQRPRLRWRRPATASVPTEVKAATTR